jgi:hypothetical protein
LITLRSVDAFTELDPCAKLTVIVVLPGATPVASPTWVPRLAMVAIVVALDDQAAFIVRSELEPSEKCPVAVNCCVAPTVMVGLMGLISMLVSVVPGWLEPHDATIATSTTQTRQDARFLDRSMGRLLSCESGAPSGEEGN